MGGEYSAGGRFRAVIATSVKASVEVLNPTTTIAGVRRSALVIGNSAYQSVPVLDNTLNNAQAVANTAVGLGYRVHLARDVGRLEMNEVVSDFLAQIEPGSEVLFYYAGHGVELQGSNYLFPIGVPMPRPIRSSGCAAGRSACRTCFRTSSHVRPG